MFTVLPWFWFLWEVRAASLSAPPAVQAAIHAVEAAAAGRNTRLKPYGAAGVQKDERHILQGVAFARQDGKSCFKAGIWTETSKALFRVGAREGGAASQLCKRASLHRCILR